MNRGTPRASRWRLIGRVTLRLALGACGAVLTTAGRALLYGGIQAHAMSSRRQPH